MEEEKQKPDIKQLRLQYPLVPSRFAACFRQWLAVSDEYKHAAAYLDDILSKRKNPNQLLNVLDLGAGCGTLLRHLSLSTRSCITSYTGWEHNPDLAAELEKNLVELLPACKDASVKQQTWAPEAAMLASAAMPTSTMPTSAMPTSARPTSAMPTTSAMPESEQKTAETLVLFSHSLYDMPNRMKHVQAGMHLISEERGGCVIILHRKNDIGTLPDLLTKQVAAWNHLAISSHGGLRWSLHQTDLAGSLDVSAFTQQTDAAADNLLSLNLGLDVSSLSQAEKDILWQQFKSQWIQIHIDTTHHHWLFPCAAICLELVAVPLTTTKQNCLPATNGTTMEVRFLCPRQAKPYLEDYLTNLRVSLMGHHQQVANSRLQQLSVTLLWYEGDDDVKKMIATTGCGKCVAVQMPHKDISRWLNTEQMTRGWWRDKMVASEREQHIKGRERWDYSRENGKIWSRLVRREVLQLHRQKGITKRQHRESHIAGCLPYIVTSQVDDWGGAARASPKHYDVIFVGTMTARRRHVLDRLKNQKPPLRVLELDNVFGVARNRLLAQSRLLLNIHADTDYMVFEEIRCAPAIYNGMPVVSEVALFDVQHPLFQHVHFATYDSLVDTVLNVLKNNQTWHRHRPELEQQLLDYSNLSLFYESVVLLEDKPGATSKPPPTYQRKAEQGIATWKQLRWPLFFFVLFLCLAAWLSPHHRHHPNTYLCASSTSNQSS